MMGASDPAIKTRPLAFDRVICDLNKRGLNCGKIHLLSSDGLLQYPELAGDYARVGIALYGVLSQGTDMERRTDG